LCNINDRVGDTGACVNNVRTVTYKYTRACNNNGSLPIYEVEDCQNITVNRFTGLGTVAGVIILLLLGFGLAILFFRQKRDLEVRYKQLKTDNNLGDSDGEEGLAQVQTPRNEGEVSLDDDDPPVEDNISLNDDDDD